MDKLKKLKLEIENMSKYHQIEILRLCKNDTNVLINENNNGSFINLTELNTTSLDNLENYVNYVIEQKLELESIENEKTRIQKNYFNENNVNLTKEFKDNNEHSIQ